MARWVSATTRTRSGARRRASSVTGLPSRAPHPGRPVDRYTLYGYTFGRLVVEGVERAGQALTRERFIDAMEGITNWDAGGVLPNVSFSATNHHAQRAGFICEMQGGRLVALSDWIAP